MLEHLHEITSHIQNDNVNRSKMFTELSDLIDRFNGRKSDLYHLQHPFAGLHPYLHIRHLLSGEPHHRTAAERDCHPQSKRSYLLSHSSTVLPGVFHVSSIRQRFCSSGRLLSNEPLARNVRQSHHIACMVVSAGFPYHLWDRAALYIPAGQKGSRYQSGRDNQNGIKEGMFPH